MDYQQLTKDFPDIPIKHPSELFKGLKKSKPITPEMIVGIDAQLLVCKLDGQANHDINLHNVIATYDRAYAVSKLSRELAIVLKNLDRKVWLKFAAEVWDNANVSKE
jgi:hypothetical protein